MCVPVAEQGIQSRDLPSFYETELANVTSAPFYVFPMPL